MTKVRDLRPKMSSKVRDSRQNVRTHRVQHVQLFPALHLVSVTDIDNFWFLYLSQGLDFWSYIQYIGTQRYVEMAGWAELGFNLTIILHNMLHVIQ